MIADARGSAIESQLCVHFDNFSKPHSLIPYRDSEDSGIAAQATEIFQSFLMYLGIMYVLGRQPTFQRANIFKNDNISIPNWSGAGSDGTYTITDYTLFFEYKGVLWGANSQGLFSYTVASNTFAETAQPISSVLGYANGLVHSKDSLAYFAYYTATASYIASKNGAGAWTVAALTIPTTTHKPVSICEYGNYLAIAFAPITAGSGLSSFVILWDRDSSFNDVSETIDLGNKDVSVLENVGGTLVAISSITGASSITQTQIIFSEYSGGQFLDFNKLFVKFGSILLTKKQKYNNRLYFALSATSIGGTLGDYSGVWAVGRNAPNAPFSVNFDRKPNNDTVAYQILGFFIVQDYAYITYLTTSGGSDYAMSKTNDALSYTATSIYRTTINPNMGLNRYTRLDPIKRKELNTILATYAPLPANGQVVGKFKVDNFAYATVFTETTDNAQVTEATALASGDAFESGRDFEFQLESTGGAEITGFAYDYSPLNTQI